MVSINKCAFCSFFINCFSEKFALSFLNSGIIIDSIYWFEFDQAGHVGNYHASETAPRGPQAVKIQPIEVPAISVDELKEVTVNFGTDSLIGEGSYGRVYYGVLKSEQAAAIKKLDASKQPDDEFLAQVSLKSHIVASSISIITLEIHIKCLYDFNRSPWFQGWSMKISYNCLGIV